MEDETKATGQEETVNIRLAPDASQSVWCDACYHRGIARGYFQCLVAFVLAVIAYRILRAE